MNETLIFYLKQAAGNDKQAFVRFAEAVGKRILSIAFRITNDKGHSEDVLNIVLLKVWQNIEKVINLKNPIGYINTIAYNTAIDIKRKQRELPLFDSIPNTQNDFDSNIDMETALSCLSDEEREIVLYHVHAGYSFRKIAGLTNSAKKSVYVKYIKAVKRLKEFFVD